MVKAAKFQFFRLDNSLATRFVAQRPPPRPASRMGAIAACKRKKGAVQRRQACGSTGSRNSASVRCCR